MDKLLRNTFFGIVSVTLYTIIASTLIFLVIAEIFNIYFGIAVFMALFGLYIISGLRRIEANPPHVAAVTFLGQRTGEVKEEGWRFFPFYPTLYGYISVEVTRIDFDLPHQIVRTPDFGELEIPVSLVFQPSREYIVNYLNSGSKEGIKKILENIVAQFLRTWAFSSEYEPRTAREGLMAGDDAVTVLAKRILGSELRTISSSIPTPILMRYFAEPQPMPAEMQVKNWGKDWSRVEAILSREHPTSDEIDNLRSEIQRRREIIRNLRDGKGAIIHKELGIVLNFLNIGDIRPIGKTAEGMDSILESDLQHEVEMKQRKAERTEIRTVQELAKKLVTELGISSALALEIVQTERGKVVKKIDVSQKQFGIEGATRDLLKGLGPELTNIAISLLKGRESESDDG